MRSNGVVGTPRLGWTAKTRLCDARWLRWTLLSQRAVVPDTAGNATASLAENVAG